MCHLGRKPSPCQGDGRGFESRLPLHRSRSEGVFPICTACIRRCHSRPGVSSWILCADETDLGSRNVWVALCMAPSFDGRRDLSPELVERDAVVERCAVDDLAVSHLHEPGVGVLVRRVVDRRAATSPERMTVSSSALMRSLVTGRKGSVVEKRLPNGASTSSMNSPLLA